MNEHHHAGQGATVLDIGDDVGALVLYTDAALAGAEIEISPASDPVQRQHAAVHRRPQNNAYAAIYPHLREGRYELWASDGTVALDVEISGGTITEARWPHEAA
jgi:hypothetical protein